MNYLNLKNIKDTLLQAVADRFPGDDRAKQWVRSNLMAYVNRAEKNSDLARINCTITPLVSARDLALLQALGIESKNLGSLEAFGAPPEWTAKVNGEGKIIHLIQMQNGCVDRIFHLVEAMQAEFPKLKTWNSITLPRAEQAATEWVEKLRRKKAEKEGEIELIGTFNWWKNPLKNNGEDVQLRMRERQLRGEKPVRVGVVKLLDKQSFDREGYRMHHCVGSYYDSCGWHGDPYREVWSLRLEPNEPQMTIEVRRYAGGKWQIQQVRGFANGAPDARLERKFVSWARERGWFDDKAYSEAAINAGYNRARLPHPIQAGMRRIELDPRGHVRVGHVERGQVGAFDRVDVIQQGTVNLPHPRGVVDFQMEFIQNMQMELGVGGGMPMVTVTGQMSAEGIRRLQDAMRMQQDAHRNGF